MVLLPFFVILKTVILKPRGLCRSPVERVKLYCFDDAKVRRFLKLAILFYELCAQTVLLLTNIKE